MLADGNGYSKGKLIYNSLGKNLLYSSIPLQWVYSKQNLALCNLNANISEDNLVFWFPKQIYCYIKQTKQKNKKPIKAASPIDFQYLICGTEYF